MQLRFCNNQTKSKAKWIQLCDRRQCWNDNQMEALTCWDLLQWLIIHDASRGEIDALCQRRYYLTYIIKSSQEGVNRSLMSATTIKNYYPLSSFQTWANSWTQRPLVERGQIPLTKDCKNATENIYSSNTSIPFLKELLGIYQITVYWGRENAQKIQRLWIQGSENIDTDTKGHRVGA